MDGCVTTYGIVASNFVSFHCYRKDLGEKMKRKSNISKMRKGMWQIKNQVKGHDWEMSFADMVSHPSLVKNEWTLLVHTES